MSQIEFVDNQSLVPDYLVCFAGGAGPFYEEFQPHIKDDQPFVESEIDWRVHEDCGDAKLQKTDTGYWVKNAREFMGRDTLNPVEGHDLKIYLPNNLREGAVVRCMDKRYGGEYMYTRGNLERLVKEFGDRVGIDDEHKKKIFGRLEERTVEAIRVLVDPGFSIPIR